MAKLERIVIELADDLTGIASADVVTRTFGLIGGPKTEIDLGPENNAQFDKDCAAYGELLEKFVDEVEELMGRYVRAGRRIDQPKPNLRVVKGGKGKGGKPTLAKDGLTPAQREAKRIAHRRLVADMRALGYPVHDKGTPRAAWVEAFKKGERYQDPNAPRPNLVEQALAKDAVKATAKAAPAKKTTAKKTTARKAA